MGSFGGASIRAPRMTVLRRRSVLENVTVPPYVGSLTLLASFAWTVKSIAVPMGVELDADVTSKLGVVLANATNGMAGEERAERDRDVASIVWRLSTLMRGARIEAPLMIPWSRALRNALGDAVNRDAAWRARPLGPPVPLVGSTFGCSHPLVNSMTGTSVGISSTSQE